MIQPHPQFGIRGLFLLVAAVSLVLAGVHRERLEIVSATIFCLTTIIGVSFLLFLSAIHLQQTAKRAIKEKRLSSMSPRIKWLIIDIGTLFWAFLGVAVSNYISENRQTDGPFWILLIAILSLPAASWIFLWQRKKAT